MATIIEQISQEAQKARTDVETQASKSSAELVAERQRQEARLRDARSKLTRQKQEQVQKAEQEAQRVRRLRDIPTRSRADIAKAEASILASRGAIDAQVAERQKDITKAEQELATSYQRATTELASQKAKALGEISDWEKGEQEKFKKGNVFIPSATYAAEKTRDIRGLPVGITQESYDTGKTKLVMSGRDPETGKKRFVKTKIEDVRLRTKSGWVNKEWYDSLTPKQKEELHKRGIDNFQAWLQNPNIGEPWDVQYESVQYGAGILPYDPLTHMYTRAAGKPIAVTAKDRKIEGWEYAGEYGGDIHAEKRASETLKYASLISSAIEAKTDKSYEDALKELKKAKPYPVEYDIASAIKDKAIPEQRLIQLFGQDAVNNAKQFARDNVHLPSGEWLTQADWYKLTPGMQEDIAKHGLDVLNYKNLKPSQQFVKLMQWGLIPRDARFEGVDETTKEVLVNAKTWMDEYVEKLLTDTSAFVDDPKGFMDNVLPERLKELPAEFKEFRDHPERIEELRKLGVDIGKGIIPVGGTIMLWKTMKPWERGASVILDVATVLPFLGMVSAGVRTTARAGTSMAKAITLSTGRALLAEVKAPVTALIHPIRTTKTILYPIETVLRPKKIPLTSLEIRSNTVKLPVEEIGDTKSAMEARDMLTDLAIQGKGAKIVRNGQEINLSPIALQQGIKPAAVHASPDIRPFLKGIRVEPGREGGVFVAPSLHTRFTNVTAFGDIAKDIDAMPGAILITDQRVLDQLAYSNKIYRSQAEIEKLIPAGIDLSEPSQILITRSAGTIEFPKDMARLLKISDRAVDMAKRGDDVGIARLQKQASKLDVDKDSRDIASQLDMALRADPRSRMEALTDVNNILKTMQKRSKSDLLYLAVIGPKYTPAEIAKLKFSGSIDLVKDIFRPAYKVKGKYAYDELIDLGDDYRKLERDLEIAKKAGNTDEVAKIKAEMKSIDNRARVLSRSIDQGAASRVPLRVITTSRGDYIDDITFRHKARTNPNELARYVSRLPSSEQSRIISTLRPTDRGKIRGLVADIPTRVTPREDTVTRALNRIAPRVDVTRRLPVGVTERVVPKVTSRITTIPRREAPPEVRRVAPTTPRVSPPIKPPPTIPKPVPVPLTGVKEYDELKDEQRKGALAWRQGWIYKYWYPPFGQKDIINTKEPIPGVKYHRGIRSAYLSIVKKGHYVPPELFREMGIYRIRVATPEKAGKPKLHYKLKSDYRGAWPQTKVTTTRKR